MGRGIDYGMGRVNVDLETGIRYGVISVNEVCQAWSDSAESDYGDPTCPTCGGDVADSTSDDAPENASKDFYCADCEESFWSDVAYGESPLSFKLDDGEYQATQSGDDHDIFVLKSPYFTRAQFCSPCAPGACYLLNPTEDGEKAYCFGHDFFEDEKAPYPVFRVDTGEEVLPKEEA